MLKTVKVPVAEIYVPTKRRGTLEPEKVDMLAESILENGLRTPIQVRQGKGRYVLVEGLHRLEACRALGDEQIDALIVAARKH